MPKLVVTTSDFSLREFDIASSMTIGRNPGNDIQLNEEKCSRTHCRVENNGSRVMLEDLKSSNGTKVNGRKVEKYVLKHGDTITIGGTTLLFQDEENAFGGTVELPSVSVPDDAPVPATAPATANDKQQGAVLPAVKLPDIPADVRAWRTRPTSAGQAEAQDMARPRSAEKAVDEAFGGTGRRTGTGSAIPAFVGGMLLMALLAAGVYYWRSRNGNSSNDEAPAADPATRTPAALPKPLPAKPKPAQLPVAAPVPPVPENLPIASSANDAALLEALNKAVAERDRALASGNLPGARSAIAGFLALHPGVTGEAARGAAQKKEETEKLIETVLQAALQEAKKAAAEKNYRLATQFCTRVVSSDPGGQFGRDARAVLAGMDEQTEPRFKELHAQGKAAVKAGQLDKGAEILERALDELGGTKWAEEISSDHRQALTTRKLLRDMEAERARIAAGGKPALVRMPNRKTDAVLTGIKGLSFEFKSGPVSMAIAARDFDPGDFQALLKALNLPGKNLETAHMWLLLERGKAAQAEIELALQNPAQAGSVAALVKLLPNQQNVRVYDFSRWQHQGDWEAQSGSWSTHDGRYVLETADGGDTSLKEPLDARAARICFDFELRNPAPGYFLAFEFGSGQQMAGVTFSEKGADLRANFGGGVVAEKEAWTPGPTHVEVAVSGETLTVAINGKARTLQTPGISSLKGALAFHIRETACAIDNIILRNVGQ